MEPRERIKEVTKYLNISAKALAEKIGYKHPQKFYDILNNKTKSITDEVANKIISQYPEISRVWLLTGEGPMLKERALNVYNVEQNGNADVVGEGASLDKRVTINGEPSNMRLEVERLKAEVSVLREQNDKLLELLAGRGRS